MTSSGKQLGPNAHAFRRCWNWLGNPRPRLSNVAGILQIVGFCATVGLFPFIWHLLKGQEPFVELYCPESIRSHEHMIFGSLAGEGYQVRVYVGPDDGLRRYWLQPSPAQSTDKGQWSLLARFGNPYGWDHVKEPPLDYEVIAALVPAAKAQDLPGTDDRPIVQLNLGEDIAQRLAMPSIQDIARCTIRRDPERCQHYPRILQPPPQVRPDRLVDVHSPVRVLWEPNLPMYVELWRAGIPLPELSHREWQPGRELDLAPGIYQLQVRYKRGSDCNAVLWFRVLLSGKSTVVQGREDIRPKTTAGADD